MFEYDPRRETDYVDLRMRRTPKRLDNPDNMTVTPRGGLLLCEDAAGNNFRARRAADRPDADGQDVYVRQNNINLTARRFGAPPRHDRAGRLPHAGMGRRLLQPGRPLALREHPDAGITFAITGPWGRRGPL